MLISKVPDNDGGNGEGFETHQEESDSHDYQTANELFELMAKNSNFDTTDVDKLTTRDLVLLYKNIDLGTKLMSNANELNHKKPNQHVETIVYNDEPESDGSDVSDIYSNEDLHNVFLINKERIDLLNTPASVENTLCHKFGDLEIQTSDLTAEYDKHFLFKDPYIKEQLKSLKIMSNSADMESTMLPTSLLDYICCKRLEDNYNFYMDNIIRYVKHTIEQLKRISNGDYLTDKAKEKWREVENSSEDCHVKTKVLATSTSIPLHVERKVGGRRSTWDDIVHSAVDIRSLSKILEKRIVVEVPKLICGSYKLLSKCCADNLIISCKKEKKPVEENNPESRVDVVFQLKRSETGQVMSNISSIMILQTAPVACDARIPDMSLPLSLPYKEDRTDDNSTDRKVKIVELEPINDTEALQEISCSSQCSDHNEEHFLDTIDFLGSDNDNDGIPSLKNSSYQESSDSSDALKEILDRKLKSSQREVSCDVFTGDLRLTIQQLTLQGALPEESGEDLSQTTTVKKRSPTRVRIKSPYENQSYIIEEKKRRKLLEIRERRERKKMALAENCKITKHKYGKGAIMPQSASSVTKLSISNKSFYNSIYGQSTNVDPSKQTKGKNRKSGKRDVIDIDLDGLDGEHDVAISTPERNSKKYTNRSYYLDDAVTEMMYMNMKRNENDGKELCSTSTSVISNDFRNNLNLLSQLIAPSETDLNVGDDKITGENQIQLRATVVDEGGNNDSTPTAMITSKSILNIVPSNSPTVTEAHDPSEKRITSSVECRKSIDKIYNLMKTLGKAQDIGNKSLKNKNVINNAEKVDVHVPESSTCQGSDSGTSLKHHLTSSNPSSFSFEKNITELLKPSSTYKQKPGSPSAVVPKVIISTKPSQKVDSEKNRKRKSVVSPIVKISENPLKAISQLLNEFENVQKTRQKPITEQKPHKRVEIVTTDGKSGSRQGSFKRRSRLDQHNEAQTERYVRVTTPKDKKHRQHTVMDVPKIPYQQSPVEEKHVEKFPKKKITDVLDEVKEARGEAVRGPSKLNSRLNSLAQPKRTYVQAHSEEYQIKYGKTIMADRLQRLAAAPPPSASDRNSGSASSRNKGRRSGYEAVSAVSVKQSSSPAPPLERVTRTRFSSPEIKDKVNQGVGPSYKQIPVPETPQTLKKKMVAVESYVKNHYGRATSTTVITEPQSAQKSRVPLMPTDIELESSSSSPQAEESTELGSRLHHIINSIIKTTSQGLEVLTECHESNSKISKDTNDDYSLAENLSRSEHVSSDSIYTIDVLDDSNVLTSVENIDKASETEQKQIKVGVTDATQYDIQPFKSSTELEKLENALCSHISVGAFQKRLRIKNLTLTPKPSVQQVLVLQSGDAGSLVVQNPIAQNLKDTTTDSFSDIKTLPVLSKSHLDWSFVNFPMQISTVGYAFPEYKALQHDSTSFIKLFDEVSKNTDEGKPENKTNLLSNKDKQCCKCGQPQLCLEQAAQVGVPASTLVTIGISSTHLMESDKKEETNQLNEVKVRPKNDIINFSENKTDNKQDSINVERARPSGFDEKEKSGSTAGNTDNIEYTTSLDILVGLLNEIQKITTCQTEMTNGDKCQHVNHQNKELETILNKAATLDSSMKSSPSNVMSFTSLDRLRQLESNQSLYSFYLSDHEGFDIDGSKVNISPEIFPLSTVPLNALPLDTAPLDTAPLDTAPLPTAPLPTAPLATVPMNTVSMNTAPWNTVSLNTVPMNTVSLNTVSLNTVPMNTVPMNTVSLNTVPINTVSLNTVLMNTVPMNTVPINTVSLNTVPWNTVSLNNKMLYSKPVYVDKEVEVDFMDQEYVNRFTDIPSQIIPISMNHTSNMTNSLIGVLSEPSTQSMISIAEYHSIYSNSSSLSHKNIDIPQIIITRESNQSLAYYEVTNQVVENSPENKMISCKKKSQSFRKEGVEKNRKLTTGKYRLKTDFDPIMKMKRDILVTVYSILVFTVFAALSFPEMLYRV